MTFRHVARVGDRQEHENLVGQLVREWTGGTQADEPLIVTEGGTQQSPKHVYVVWEAWCEMGQRERSEIIMDAAEQVYERDAAMEITVAMGLTKEEARRMKMASALGID